MNIVVLGSGGWGTAAAMLLSDNGHTVALWSHDPKKAELLDKTRENPLLKGVRIPERIAVTSDLTVLQNAEMAVFASPSFALRSVAHEAAPHLKKGTLLVSLTKGIERGTHLRMSEIIAQECGEGYRIAVLSGPSHAEEVARRLPTGCVAASASTRTTMSSAWSLRARSRTSRRCAAASATAAAWATTPVRCSSLAR